MAGWVEITSIDYLDPYYFGLIAGNLQYISEQLNANGYTVSIIPPQISDANMDIALIMAQFNITETTIQALHGVIDWVDDYFEVFAWTTDTADKYTPVQRWLNWMNGMYRVISRQEQKRQYLLDYSGEHITDANGDRILTLEGYF